MLRKLFEGFIFGIGFSFACILVAVFVLPQLLPISFRSFDRPSPVASQRIASPPLPQQPHFHELPVEEQIKQASVIALARYEPSLDGKMKAVIQEFLKKEPNTVINYNVGDEYASSSFYPNPGHDHGDGVVIFFVGSQASRRLAVTYSGDRIRGLSDIPLELFRKKCAAPNA